jgi:hypothetical protein
MAEIPEPQKPIPQFTIRWMLGLMTGWAIVFSIIALAMRGQLWALGVSVGLGVLVLFMLIGAALFALIWAVSLFGSGRNYEISADRSPFANNARPNASDPFSDGDGAE